MFQNFCVLIVVFVVLLQMLHWIRSLFTQPKMVAARIQLQTMSEITRSRILQHLHPVNTAFMSWVAVSSYLKKEGELTQDERQQITTAMFLFLTAGEELVSEFISLDEWEKISPIWRENMKTSVEKMSQFSVSFDIKEKP